MKFEVLLVLLFTSTLCKGQARSYEQVAWDFYNEIRVDETSSNHRPTLWVSDFETSCPLFYDTICSAKLDFDVNNTKERIYVEGMIGKITWTHSEKYKIKNLGRGRYPIVRLAQSFSNKVDQQIVTVIEEYKDKAILYHIEMMDNGQVKNWCKGELIKVE